MDLTVFFLNSLTVRIPSLFNEIVGIKPTCG